jgi:hypothetical protein
MANTRLLQGLCALALLAAAPAFAQSEEKSSMGQAGTTASSAPTPPAPHPARHGTVMRSSHKMHSPSPSADTGEAAVNRLNDQSYQAAQQGQPYTSK